MPVRASRSSCASRSGPTASGPAPTSLTAGPSCCLPDQFSFPSGHTITAFAVTVSLAMFYPGAAIPLLFCSISVAASRIMLGMHFLSDVLAGAAIGSSLALGSVWLIREPCCLISGLPRPGEPRYTVSDMFGAIEAGGTKFVCGAGTGPDDLSIDPDSRYLSRCHHRRVHRVSRPPESAIRRHRLLRSGGPQPDLLHLRPHHVHTQARLAQLRFRGNRRQGAPRPGRFRHRRERSGSRRSPLGCRAEACPISSISRWARESAAAPSPTAACCMACSTPRWDTSVFPTSRAIPTPASVPTTATAWKAWPPVRRSTHAGERPAQELAARPSRLGHGSALPGTGTGHLGVHPLSAPHRDRRRSHAAGAPVPSRSGRNC